VEWLCHDRRVVVADVQRVLRALAEARDKDFYPLWVRLTYVWRPPLPEIGFRIYQIADTADARVAVSVTGTRPDGARHTWGIAVDARSETITVATALDVDSPDGDEVDEVFGRTAETGDPARAAGLIRTMAAELCGQRWPLGAPDSPG
jgi:hypothetical protein